MTWKNTKFTSIFFILPMCIINMFCWVFACTHNISSLHWPGAGSLLGRRTTKVWKGGIFSITLKHSVMLAFTVLDCLFCLWIYRPISVESRCGVPPLFGWFRSGPESPRLMLRPNVPTYTTPGPAPAQHWWGGGWGNERGRWRSAK